LPAASINNVIGERFIELLSVDSTNNYAMQHVQNGSAKGGEVYFAYEQTAGRGQFNRQWFSTKGENIMLSAVLCTSAFAINKQFILNMVTALSIQQLFNKYSTENTKIKWPNDIYCRDRKAAGILIENIVRGKIWQFAIIGIGININQTKFPDVLHKPVSLKQITGKHHNVIELAKELCSLLNKNLQQLFSNNEAVVLKNYNEELYRLNELIQFKYNSENFIGVVNGVNNLGQLIIQIDKEEKAFATGSIEWMQ